MSKISFSLRPVGASSQRLSGLASLMRAWSERRRRERRRREGYRGLLGLDDDILADIGLSRGQVEHAARFPRSIEAEGGPENARGRTRPTDPIAKGASCGKFPAVPPS